MLKRTLCIWLSIGVLVILVSSSFAQKTYEDLTFPPLEFSPPQIERYTLENGMKLFFVQDHELPVISMYALIKTGQIYEPAEKIGLGFMMSEVMRTGGTATRSPDEINQALEYLAASVEVDIAEESGSVELWTLKKNLQTSLEIFVDILRHPAFEQAKVDLVKSQMLELIRRRNDSPPQIRGREFMRVLYGKAHPVARIPQVETVMNVTREDFVAFHQRYVHPNNILLAVTGDFESEDMLKILTQVFQDWQPQELTFPDVETVEYEFEREVYLVHQDVEQTNLALGHLGITADNPDYPAIRVMDLILGAGGFSSRLFQEVRNERGLTYSIGSYFGGGTRDYGAFLIYCSTSNDTVGEAISVILEEIQRLTVEEVSDEELEAAKNQYLNSFVFKFATVDDVVRRKMFYEYLDYPPDYLETFRDNVMAVTKDDVLRVAKTYLHPAQTIILAVGNREDIQENLRAFGQVQDIELEPVE